MHIFVLRFYEFFDTFLNSFLNCKYLIVKFKPSSLSTYIDEKIIYPSKNYLKLF